jgi:hypothetical protein
MNRLQVLTITLLVSGFAQSTICGPRPSVTEEYQQSSAVFVAEVVNVQRFSNTATLKVTRTLKGNVANELKEFAGTSGDFVFAPGKTYLVFADSISNDRVQVGMCGPTKELSEAKGDLQEIEQFQINHPLRNQDKPQL